MQIDIYHQRGGIGICHINHFINVSSNKSNFNNNVGNTNIIKCFEYYNLNKNNKFNN